MELSRRQRRKALKGNAPPLAGPDGSILVDLPDDPDEW